MACRRGRYIMIMISRVTNFSRRICWNYLVVGGGEHGTLPRLLDDINLPAERGEGSPGLDFFEFFFLGGGSLRYDPRDSSCLLHCSLLRIMGLKILWFLWEKGR